MKLFLVLLTMLALAGCRCSPAPSPVPPAPSPPAPGPTGTGTLSLRNETSVSVKAFFAFGADSVVLPADWGFCRSATKLTCELELAASGLRDLPLAGRYLNVTMAFGSPVGCGSTKAELNLNNPRWYDVTDVSLVDGYSNELEIDVSEPHGPSDAGTRTLGPPRGRTGNEKVYGLYPLGCDVCTARQSPPCGMVPGKDGCKGGSQYHPDVPCQDQGTVMGGGSTVLVRYQGLPAAAKP